MSVEDSVKEEAMRLINEEKKRLKVLRMTELLIELDDNNIRRKGIELRIKELEEKPLYAFKLDRIKDQKHPF